MYDRYRLKYGAPDRAAVFDRAGIAYLADERGPGDEQQS